MNAQPHKPEWFRNQKVLVINAPTCGINKDGDTQYKVSKDGTRSLTEVDDKLYDTVCAVCKNEDSPHHEYKSIAEIVGSQVWVPQYHDKTSEQLIEHIFGSSDQFRLMTLESLLTEGKIMIKNGHGSPSSDQRIGDIPYIKVSDIRAGQININPTNRIPRELAMKFWRGDTSKLQAYDLVSPERASKNIGEFAILMPGQESIVLTKEVIIIRSLVPEEFDQFYLMWALSLKAVREQWKRVILMQTNREDVGNRYLQIKIPVPASKEIGDDASKGFRNYYRDIAAARYILNSELEKSGYEYVFQLG